MRASTMTMAKKKTCFWSDLGMMSLPKADLLMRELVKCRIDDRIPDLLLLMSHYPCLSLGARKLNSSDLLKSLEWFEGKGIPLIKTMRGGGLTYLWPGQLACYPILKLTHQERKLDRYMFFLEEVGIRVLDDLGIKVKRKREHVAQIGLWYESNKIGSMGIHMAKGVTSFGFAINLDGDKDPSRFIRPCGLPDVHLTTVSNITGKKPQRSSVISLILKHFQEVFKRTFRDSPCDLDNMLARLRRGHPSPTQQ